MISMSDPTYPLFPVFAFIGFILSAIPLSWHIHAWNSGTCAYMIWTGVACLIFFVNSIVWANDLNNPAPVWCDISSKIIVGVSVGIPASTLCISRRLYYLTAGNTVSVTRDDKRRMVITDIGIAAVLPAIIMILHYIVQGHRFDIYENIGCYPVVYNTLPAYFLYFMWPIVFGIISFIFSSLTLRSFWLRRLQMNQLISSNSSMTMSRYLRLVFLALIDIMCTVPLGVFTVYIGNKGVTLAPWISWEDTHFNFSRVGLFPAILWRSDPAIQTSMELARWLPVVCSFLFFALFGFAEEAKKNYRKAFWAVMKLFSVRPAPPKSKGAPYDMNKGSYNWTKPDFKSNDSSTVITHVALSPTSLSSTSRKLNRSNSFSTSASTHIAADVELTTYKAMPIHPDIEKLAGLPSPIHSDDSETIYGTPPVYYLHSYPSESKHSLAATGSGYPDVPISPTGWSSAMRIEDVSPPPSPGAIVLRSLPPPPPKKAGSAASMRVPVPPIERTDDVAVVSDSSDRVYISPMPRSATRLVTTHERTHSPSSPLPFVDAAPYGVSETLPQVRQTLQVRVQQTETTTSETV